MQVEKIRLEQLVPSDYNPRLMSENEKLKLSKNLEKFGLVDPIIINLKNMHIIGGHQRYNILAKKNENTNFNLIRLGDIGWVFEDKELTIQDSNHEKALNLSLNSLDGEFNPEKVGEILTELQLNDMDMDLTGFEDYEVLDYTLDYDMELLEAENTGTNEPETNNNFNINNDLEGKTIHFSTPHQRDKFNQWIIELKQSNPEQTITQSITHYIKQRIHKKPKTYDYTILFDSVEEKKQFMKYYKQLEKQYKQDPLLNLVDEK